MLDVKLTEAERRLLNDRLASWFGDSGQGFLVADLAPTVERIIAERIPATFAVAANLRARLAEALADLAEAHETIDRRRGWLRAAIAEGAQALDRLDQAGVREALCLCDDHDAARDPRCVGRMLDVARMAAEARAEALRDAADFFEQDMAAAWGGRERWLTSGDQVGELVASILHERADEPAAHEAPDA